MGALPPPHVQKAKRGGGIGRLVRGGFRLSRAGDAMRQASPPDRRRIIPVRLVDVPLEVRLKGARVAKRAEVDPFERLRIDLAAHSPDPEFVGWIASG